MTQNFLLHSLHNVVLARRRKNGKTCKHVIYLSFSSFLNLVKKEFTLWFTLLFLYCSYMLFLRVLNCESVSSKRESMLDDGGNTLISALGERNEV